MGAWGWPQWVMAVLMGLNLYIYFAKHGEPKGTWDVRDGILNFVVMSWLLYMGGFWNG